MTGSGRPRRQRRKDAQRAGVAKGTLYRYFETKDDLFRAVARAAIAANLEAIQGAAMAFDGSLAEFVPMLLARAGNRMGDSRLPAIARMVISESHAVPDLGRIWHDDVASKMLALLMLTSIIARGQERGEVREGDPRLHAFSIVGPMMMGVLFHEVFSGAGADLPDLGALAKQHAETVLRGLLNTSDRPRA